MRQISFGRMKMLARGTPTSSENQTATEFEDLAMPLVNSAYNLARWLLQNDNDAEDLVQETYLKAFQNFRSFHPGTNFRAWIFRILRNTFLTSRSTLERRMTVALDWEDELPSLRSNCASPESLLIQKSNIAAIRDAIEQLPFSYREVILLCDVEGLAYREIAEILEIPIGTVMSRLARARKVVRDALRPTQTEHYRQPTSALEEAGRQTSCAHQQHLYV
jgi:RNA polymerase sigma factor (sigma-70 family)